MIGTLGSAVFETSTDKVFTWNSFSRSGSARYEEHAVVGKKPVLELIGPGLESLSISMRFDVALGINPIVEINKLRESRDNGDILPMTIGGKYLGDWVIESLSEEWQRTDNKGNLLVASVQFNLKEEAA